MASVQGRAGSLSEVVRLCQKGQFAAARELGEGLLKTNPSNAALLTFVGIACCQAGALDRGAELLRRSLAINLGDDAARFNLCRVLLDLGQSDEAETLCRQLPLDADPSYLRLLGDILKKAGKASEAIDAYSALLEKQPGDFSVWNNLGTTRLEAGDAEGAVSALERAKALQPGSALIRQNLGRAQAAAGRFDDSVAELEEAARRTPENAGVLLELGQALNRVGRSRDALPYLGTAARIDQGNAEIFTTIGLTFADLGEFDRAEQGYRFALQAQPDYAPAYLNLGTLLEQSNRIDELKTLLGQAREKGVAGDEVAYLEALLLRRQGDLSGALGKAQGLGRDAIDEILSDQLIGQLADRTGDADLAFEAFTAMNRAMMRDPSALAFDGSEHRRYVEGLAAMTTPEWFGRWQSVDLPGAPPAPVFLVGFPRSGTTLLDTILMGHPDTHVLEEEPVMARVRDALGDQALIADIGAGEVAQLRDRYFRELATISPAPAGRTVIDKLPLNILRVPLIHRIFPDAKFIFAVRHPCDVVLSCFMQNFKVNQAMASFLDLENAARFYDAVLSYWKQCQAIFPLNVHFIRYEDVVADLESEMRALIGFLGLEWSDALLAYDRTATERGMIRTPSYAQVTEPIYARAKGRWQRYRRHMEPVLPILEPWAKELGYPPLDVVVDAG
jgi:tetratricopeptide (TPR) repeat protein